MSSSEVNLPSFFPSSSLSSSPREVGKRRRRLLRKIGVSSENCSTRRRGKGIERERERERNGKVESLLFVYLVNLLV